jgi:hypothetical protein
MVRGFRLSLAIVLSFVILSQLPAPAGAEPPHSKPHIHIYKWHGYGFLPGYHQPPSNSVPIYSHRSVARNAPPDVPPGFVSPYFAPVRLAPAGDAAPGSHFPNYGTPQYWWGGGWHYFGDPGFLHGRYNGGSYGPCWTSTPIGLMWNCG